LFPPELMQTTVVKQNCWVFELCPLSGVLKTKKKNTTFRKVDLFPFSDEGEKHLLCWVL
jgi:hypothetical protein